jgi:tRNA1(Val) A37 N6-methylase TrmN6
VLSVYLHHLYADLPEGHSKRAIDLGAGTGAALLDAPKKRADLLAT